MADKYVQFDPAIGLDKQVEFTTSSAGVGDAGKGTALGTDGKFHVSMMPSGIGADTKNIPASENLSAGDFVNVWNDGGTVKVRKADASTSGKLANGFVLEAVTSGNDATVYFNGDNTAVTSVTGGRVFLSASIAGGFVSTAPSIAGNVVQDIGTGTSATSIFFEPKAATLLA